MRATGAFYTAQLGAAAALGGLVFVGLSLNLKKILGSGMEVYALHKVNLQSREAFIINLVLLEFGIIPFIVGGLLLLFGAERGFYWVAAGVMTSFIKAVMDPWVLLVEINR